MAKSNYGQIKKYENEILAMKEAGYTKRRIAEEFPKIKVQISTPIHSLLFFKDGYYPPNSYDYDSDSNNDSYWLCICFDISSTNQKVEIFFTTNRFIDHGNSENKSKNWPKPHRFSPFPFLFRQYYPLFSRSAA